ncbi:hypothetical protein BYT27DRAFT_7156472 [Phlegmacium glaucopus]|nr:hypothetical protein BYT27DRAFT_7156472 [Phlegmacium glaucopus]
MPPRKTTEVREQDPTNNASQAATQSPSTQLSPPPPANTNERVGLSHSLVEAHDLLISGGQFNQVHGHYTSLVINLNQTTSSGLPVGTVTFTNPPTFVPSPQGPPSGSAPSKETDYTNPAPSSGQSTLPDIVGFSTSGVIILRNSIQVQPLKVINNFGYNAGGWRVEKHVRLVADTTGDKQADIVGFGKKGVWISVNKGNNTFEDPPKLVLRDFSYSAGWRVEKHIRYMADIRKTGRADIVGFGDYGVLVSLNNGGGSFTPARLASNSFGYVEGWRLEKHPRFLADVTGNGLLDIVGFGSNSVFIGNNNGNGTFQAIRAVLHDFCYNAGGWRVEKHPRFVADLTGDGKADIIGFGCEGVYVSLNNGDGKFGAVNRVIDDFGYNNADGWRVEKHPRFIADLTGNKRGDVVGFGDAGVCISINNGNGTFGPVKRVIDDFGYTAGGWRVEKHLRFAVDLTGNGCADIIGFGEHSVLVSYNDGKGNFGPVQRLTDAFAYNGGEWTLENTLRLITKLNT